MDLLLIRISLPLPPICLQPNRNRGHWGKRKRATADARATAKLAAMSVLRNRQHEFASRPEMLPRFYFSCRRKRDDDNLVGWLKAYRDGIADALGVDDNEIFTQRPIQFVDKSNPRVEIDVVCFG